MKPFAGPEKTKEPPSVPTISDSYQEGGPPPFPPGSRIHHFLWKKERDLKTKNPPEFSLWGNACGLLREVRSGYSSTPLRVCRRILIVFRTLLPGKKNFMLRLSPDVGRSSRIFSSNPKNSDFLFLSMHPLSRGGHRWKDLPGKKSFRRVVSHRNSLLKDTFQHGVIWSSLTTY